MDRSQYRTDDEDFQDDGSFWLSFNKLYGHKVVDIIGFVSDPYDGGPSFIANYLVLDTGEKISLQGEHDEVFVDNRTFRYPSKELVSDKLLESLMEGDYEDEDDGVEV